MVDIIYIDTNWYVMFLQYITLLYVDDPLILLPCIVFNESWNVRYIDLYYDSYNVDICTFIYKYTGSTWNEYFLLPYKW